MSTTKTTLKADTMLVYYCMLAYPYTNLQIVIRDTRSKKVK